MSGIRFGDHVGATVRRDGDVVGYTESPRHGSSASSETAHDGSLIRTAAGASPQNEARALLTAQILVRWLNSHGLEWQAPLAYSNQASDTDCLARHLRSDDRLLIQVVRADAEPGFWRSLGSTGAAERRLVVDTAVRLIAGAVNKKAVIPQSQRASLVLALDATLTPELIHSDVVVTATATLTSDFRSLGFRAIYLVGPEQQHVHRLDADDPA